MRSKCAGKQHQHQPEVLGEGMFPGDNDDAKVASLIASPNVFSLCEALCANCGAQIMCVLFHCTRPIHARGDASLGEQSRSIVRA